MLHLNSTIMRKRYSPPVAKGISVGAFVMASSDVSRSARKVTDFDADDEEDGNGWNVWNRTK